MAIQQCQQISYLCKTGADSNLTLVSGKNVLIAALFLPVSHIQTRSMIYLGVRIAGSCLKPGAATN